MVMWVDSCRTRFYRSHCGMRRLCSRDGCWQTNSNCAMSQQCVALQEVYQAAHYRAFDFQCMSLGLLRHVMKPVTARAPLSHPGRAVEMCLVICKLRTCKERCSN